MSRRPPGAGETTAPFSVDEPRVPLRKRVSRPCRDTWSLSLSFTPSWVARIFSTERDLVDNELGFPENRSLLSGGPPDISALHRGGRCVGTWTALVPRFPVFSSPRGGRRAFPSYLTQVSSHMEAFPLALIPKGRAHQGPKRLRHSPPPKRGNPVCVCVCVCV